MKFNRMQILAAKNTAKAVAGFKRELTKVEKRIEEDTAKKAELETIIEDWEAPIKKMTGFTSEEILNNVDTEEVAIENTESEVSDSVDELPFPEL